MRTLVIALLLAGTASPAFSQFRDRSDDNSSRSERSERSERPSRAERMESRSKAMESRREQRTQRVEREAPAAAQVQQQAPAVEQQNDNVRQRSFQGSRGGFRQQVRQREDTGAVQGNGYAPRERFIRTIPDTSPAPVVTQQTRDGITTQHRSRDGRRWSGDTRRWDRDSWRGDRRYDWRRWRDRHRSTFRLGLYIDPFGWGYRRWGIGSYLYPNYYQSSFWINDPWMYRLPPAYPPYRWVRYHNDALLIDTWSGEVVDVIYNFFW